MTSRYVTCHSLCPGNLCFPWCTRDLIVRECAPIKQSEFGTWVRWSPSNVLLLSIRSSNAEEESLGERILSMSTCVVVCICSACLMAVLLALGLVLVNIPPWRQKCRALSCHVHRVLLPTHIIRTYYPTLWIWSLQMSLSPPEEVISSFLSPHLYFT